MLTGDLGDYRVGKERIDLLEGRNIELDPTSRKKRNEQAQDQPSGQLLT
jgi:hypothetical protein